MIIVCNSNIGDLHNKKKDKEGCCEHPPMRRRREDNYIRLQDDPVIIVFIVFEGWINKSYILLFEIT